MPRRRKRRHSQGLDQLGPTQYWKTDGSLKIYLKPHPQSINARVSCSRSRWKAKITLSDHLMSSDEIKTKEDE